LWALQALFLGALSLSAFVRIPLPFTPVPLTLQVFVVFLAALFLGGRASLPVVGGYLVLGGAGLPVFSGGAGMGHLFGATGGYLFGFLVAAWVVGSTIGRASSNPTENPEQARRLGRDAAILALGLLLLYALGALWFAALTRMSFGSVLSMTVVPFIGLDAVKVATAYSLYRVAGKPVGRFLA